MGNYQITDKKNKNRKFIIFVLESFQDKKFRKIQSI